METLSAAPLDLDVRSNVADPVFLAAWDAWYRHDWRPFYEKYAAPGAASNFLHQFGAFFESDTLAERAEAQRAELEDFYRSYAQQRTAAGTPVPVARGLVPTLIALPQNEPAIPAWVWPLGALAVLGGGYLLLRPHLQAGFRKDRFLAARDLRRSMARADRGRRVRRRSVSIRRRA